MYTFCREFEKFSKQGNKVREEMEDDLKAMEAQLAEEFGRDSSSSGSGMYAQGSVFETWRMQGKK